MNNSKYVDPFSDNSKRLALEFDEATDKKDVNRLRVLIVEAQKLLESENLASKASIYYSLGTVLEDLKSMTEDEDEYSLSKIIYHYRKSISLVESDELNKCEFQPYVLSLKRNLYINYANALYDCGRLVFAIEYYKKVLLVDNSFGMALGNLGRAYRHYGMLDYDNSHKHDFQYYAYSCLSRAIECNDPNTHPFAKRRFAELIDSYSDEYVNDFLSKDIEFKEYVYDDENELAYRKWCLNKGLFLNTLNDLPVEELCFAGDVLQLPDMIANIDDKPIFHGMFSQLKQEYIYARYLYYSSLNISDGPHFADKETYIMSYTDFTEYSIRTEKIKTVFKTLYGMFDKIAYFISHYFDLGLKEKDINFRAIWKDTAGYGKNEYKLKNKLEPSKNFCLSCLCWISKDFFESLEDSPNPELKRLKDIRNALEHKYVKIHDSSEVYINENGDGLALYVTENELYDITFDLLKIIREALINLSLCVNIAELQKREQIKNKPIVSMQLLSYDDNWKV